MRFSVGRQKGVLARKNGSVQRCDHLFADDFREHAALAVAEIVRVVKRQIALPDELIKRDGAVAGYRNAEIGGEQERVFFRIAALLDIA